MSVTDSSSKESSENSVSLQSLNAKQKFGDATNRWLERNRSMVLRQTPVWAQSLAALMIGLGSIAVVGGIFFRIDEVVTVQGQLKSIGGTVDVETPAGGRIAEVLFSDGDTVSKGQLLLRFDTRESENKSETLIKIINLQKKKLSNDLNVLRSQQVSVNSRYEVMSQRINTKQIIVNEMMRLVELGGFQKLQYLEQLDQLFEMKKQLSEVEEQKNRLTLQIDKVKLDSTQSLDQLRNQLRQAQLRLQYQNVEAPVSGVVFDPVARVNGVLQPGERILSLVPQTGLFAEVNVSNQDIGFVKQGQEAKIRVDAFPFTRYGEIVGAVDQIGADSLPPDNSSPFYRFPVKITMNSFRLKSKNVSIPLSSGMSITANLKLRDKPIISLLSDLLVDQTDSIRNIRQQ